MAFRILEKPSTIATLTSAYLDPLLLAYISTHTCIMLILFTYIGASLTSNKYANRAKSWETIVLKHPVPSDEHGHRTLACRV